jgi:hypothetical protein
MTAVVGGLTVVRRMTAVVGGLTVVGGMATVVRGLTVVVIVVAAVIAAITAIDIAVVVAATAAVEAITAPAVAIAPVGPGSYAEEDAVVEVAGAVVAIGSAGVGGVVIVAPAANGRGSSNDDGDLRARRGWRERQTG